MYTVFGSIFLWFSLSFLIEVSGVSNFDDVSWVISNIMNSSTRKILFLMLFLGFAIKVPLVPFHHWLIIAHVEATTNGSIILAALLLKVGTYAMYRFVYLLFPLESYFFLVKF
jgi:NADH-quinone oxidoreductase subunit M